MNKVINGLTLLICIAAGIFAMVIGFDLILFGLNPTKIEYKQEIFLGAAMLIAALGLLRLVIRRRNLKIFSDESKFELIVPISKSAMSHVNLYLIIEAIFMLLMGLMFFWISELSRVISVVFLVLLIEQVVFIVQAQKQGFCKVGMTTLALLSVDRESDVLYYNGIKKVDIDLGRLYFDYKGDLQLSIRIDNISSEDKVKFDETLRKCLSKKNVFYTDGYIDYMKK